MLIRMPVPIPWQVTVPVPVPVLVLTSVTTDPPASSFFYHSPYVSRVQPLYPSLICIF
jgi:hypothetical protein